MNWGGFQRDKVNLWLSEVWFKEVLLYEADMSITIEVENTEDGWQEKQQLESAYWYNEWG